VVEDDPLCLIEQACGNLTETMGYHNAWIALLGGEAARGLGLQTEGPVAAAAAAGFDGGFEILRKRLERGQFPNCMARAMESGDTLVKGNPAADCSDCPLHGQYGGRAGLVRRLEADGVIYGILTVSVPAAYARDDEEQDFFNEVAGDLAFALYKITAARKLEENRQHLALVIEGSDVGTWEWNVRTNETRFNEQWAAMLGYTIEELTPYDYATWERLVHPGDLGQARQALADCVEGRTTDYNCEFRMRHKDGRWVWILDRGRIMTRDDVGKALSMFGTHTDITDLKQTEESLRRQHAMLARTEALAHVGSWAWEAEGDKVTWSEELFRIFGLEPREQAPPFAEHQAFYVPADRARLAKAVEDCLQNGVPYALEVRFTRTDGQLRHCIVRGIPEHGADGAVNRLYGSLHDITEIKRARERIAILGHMLDEAPASITIHDTEGRFLYANRKTVALHGYAGLDELLKINLHELDVPESEALLAERFCKINEAGEARFDVKHYRKDGSTFPLEILAKQIEWEGRRAVLSIATDITERRQAEEAFARQQRSIKLSSQIASVFLISSRNEVFADVLDVLLSALDSRFGFFGYIDEAGDLVCPSMTREIWDQCQVPEKSIVFPRADWGGLWGRSLMEKQTLVANENLRIPEGHVALDNALATPIVHHDKLIGQFVVADKAGGYNKDDRDLLESVAAQTAPILFAIQEDARQKKVNEKLEEQMRQAQKMEAVGRLAGGVAHDFNNMLGIILGHADMLLEEMDPDQALYADLTEIRKAGERSADLTRQLLAFARKQTVAPKVIDLNKTVAGMLNMLQRLIGEDIDMAWIPGEKMWPVKIDPAQIDQVLANLCVNARDAIADVGKVTIETGNIVFDEEYCKEHAGFVPGEYTLLTVSDNGCGMNAETLENIFEPFFTTKESDKGTGLGLATVYGVVKQNNGFINVYSEPGQGTTFRIYLPRHRTKEVRWPDKEAIRPAARGHETILLVEDEPAILRMTTMMLERTGYTVLAAGTPGEAIALAREHAGDIHLLMTDVVMPEMNGRDLAKNLLSLYPNLKLLFMSGYTANVIAHHGVLDEGVQFIQKPFSKTDLGVKVRAVLDRK
jgi:PAS domain S-box-containing protein